MLDSPDRPDRQGSRQRRVRVGCHLSDSTHTTLPTLSFQSVCGRILFTIHMRWRLLIRDRLHNVNTAPYSKVLHRIALGHAVYASGHLRAHLTLTHSARGVRWALWLIAVALVGG